MSPVEIVVWVASVVSAIAVLAGAVWWLVWPRVEDKLEQISRQVRGVDTQLSSDDPDTISRYARVAAGAASQLPGINEKLSEVAATQQAIEEWRTSFERRLMSLEQGMLALLQRELRNRVFDSPADFDPDPNLSDDEGGGKHL